MTTASRADSRAQTELAILRRYAGGGDIKDIAAALNVVLDDVSKVVAGANFQRTRAAELVRQREASLPVAAPPPAPRQDVDVQPQPDTIEQVLRRAEATGKTRLTTQAGRIRTLVDELRRNLDDTAKVLAVEARIERAKAELAAATEQLKALTRPGVPGVVVTDAAPAAKDVRAWAAAHGVACPASGRVPGDVIAKYLASKEPTA